MKRVKKIAVRYYNPREDWTDKVQQERMGKEKEHTDKGPDWEQLSKVMQEGAERREGVKPRSSPIVRHSDTTKNEKKYSYGLRGRRKERPTRKKVEAKIRLRVMHTVLLVGNQRPDTILTAREKRGIQKSPDIEGGAYRHDSQSTSRIRGGDP